MPAETAPGYWTLRIPKPAPSWALAAVLAAGWGFREATRPARAAAPPTAAPSAPSAGRPAAPAKPDPPATPATPTASPEKAAETPAKPPSVAPPTGPKAPEAAAVDPPRPWQTTVRLRRANDGGKAEVLGSGTIIESDARASTVLTCGHLFSDGTAGTVVELFDGKLTGLKPARVTATGERFAGEVLAVDRKADVAIVRFAPGRELPSSPVAPATYRAVAGVDAITVGCSGGADATAWSTKLSGVGPDGRIWSTKAPRQGRSGGGLFLVDGTLIGVCNFADSSSDKGIYAGPAAIARIIARAGSIGAPRSSASSVVLLDFDASWCGPCRAMRPIVERLAARGASVRKIDPDRDPGAVAKWSVTGFPTFIAVDASGRELGRIVGVTSAAELAALLESR